MCITQIFAVNASRKADEVQDLFQKMLKEPYVETKKEEKKEEEQEDTKTVVVEAKRQTCCICMSNEADHLSIPCGHQSSCYACINQLYTSGKGKQTYKKKTKEKTETKTKENKRKKHQKTTHCTN
jgi:Zinc finger, C3HC4 type (RING finger)